MLGVDVVHCVEFEAYEIVSGTIIGAVYGVIAWSIADGNPFGLFCLVFFTHTLVNFFLMSLCKGGAICGHSAAVEVYKLQKNGVCVHVHHDSGHIRQIR